jgi:hypothetical protein
MDRFTKFLTISALILSCVTSTIYVTQNINFTHANDIQIYQFSPKRSPEQTALSVNDNNPISIRLLILKHSQEQIADDDARLAARGAMEAAAKGLSIHVIGDDYATSLQKIEELVNAKVKTKATSGDTLIVHTIGHGFQDGTLHNIGQRSSVVKLLAKVAEQNEQEILWWQLSCYAASHLPSIDSLKPEEQDRLSMLASSSASQQSPIRVQAEIMSKLFLALAEKNKSIDANGDDIITVGELRTFLNSLDNRKRGDLFFAKSADRPIFGYTLLMRLIPIVDRNNPQKKYPRDYIPIPKRYIF